MSTQIINQIKGSTVDTTGANSELIITRQGAIFTEVADAITELNQSSANSIIVNGFVRSIGGRGILSEGFQSSVAIGVTGAVTGDVGILIRGGGTTIDNAGRINSDAEAVSVFSKSTVIDNSGLIGGMTGIGFYSSNAEVNNEANGYIYGQSVAMSFANSPDGSVSHINNQGTIEGGSIAILGFNESEIVVNRGTIIGAVDLGDGDDSFDNRGGTVDGEIFGGLGGDTYIIDSSTTELRENSNGGTDTVKTTVNLILADFFENLVLLGKANLNGTGNSGANDIDGNAGNNRLSGRLGEDILDGHRGNDQLTGGGNSDIFIFGTGYSKDTITDFKDGRDFINLDGLRAMTTFDDLKENHTTEVGANLVITYGTDVLTIRNMTLDQFSTADIVLF